MIYLCNSPVEIDEDHSFEVFLSNFVALVLCLPMFIIFVTVLFIGQYIFFIMEFN